MDTTSSTSPTSPTGPDGTAAVTETFQVVGMTCAHCVRAVTAELMDVAGVGEVSVDLSTGQVTVSSAHPLTEADVRAAIDEAGYSQVTP